MRSIFNFFWFCLAVNIIIVFVILPLKVPAQNFNFKHISIVNGLSSNEVRAVFEDSNGFIWFATGDGLNRWDGYTFKVFKNFNDETNSLPTNFLLCIAEDHEKNIWIGTNHGGLAKYSTTEEMFYRYTLIENDSTSIPGLVVRDIQVDQYNNVWVGTHLGLAQYNVQQDNFTRIVLPENSAGNQPDIRELMPFGENEIMIQCDEGFFKLSPQSEKITRFEINAPGLDPDIFSQNNPVCFDTKGFMWIGTQTGLVRLNLKSGNHKTFQPHPLDDNCINSQNFSVIYEDSKQNLWIGTENRGINLYHHETEQFTHFTSVTSKRNSIANNIISNIYEDSNSNVWFSTLEGGVSYFSYKNTLFEFFVHDPLDKTTISSNKVGAFYEDSDGTVWVGTEEGGLNQLLHDQHQFVRHQLNTSYIAPGILSITQHRAGSVLLSGLRIGLYQFDVRSKKFINLLNDNITRELHSIIHITNIGFDSKGYLWMVTHDKEGIVVYDPANHQFYNASNPGPFDAGLLSLPHAVSIYEDSKKRLWVVTYLGLYMYDTKLNKFLSNNNDLNTPGSNYLYTLFEDSRKNIWIGNSNGLDRLLETDGKLSFERYNEKFNLPPNVKAILEDDDGNLWLSSNQGISKFNPSTTEIRNYNIGKELDDLEFSERVCLKSSTGCLYFGGTNGFVRFNPSQIDEFTPTPKVYIVDFQIFNVSQTVSNNPTLKQSIIYSSKIDLMYNQSVLSFEYAALDYSNYKSMGYAYKMEGFDENWIFAGDKRFATYTNLSPGTYTFRVKTTHGNQLTENDGASLQIEIHPPFWRTYTAYVFYLLLFIFVLYLFRRSIIYREKLKNELLLEKNQIRSIVETNMMKLRFFTNISHEFRTPLTLIKAPIDKLITSNDNIKKEERIYILKLIQSNSDKLLRMVNQLLDYRKLEAGSLVLEPSNGDIVAFCRNIWSVFEMMARQKEIDYNFETSFESQIMLFDADKMDKVITNLLSNAFKYTREGGQINISVDMENVRIENNIESQKYIRIIVKDSGIGIPEKDVPRIFERFYNASRKGYEKFEGTGIGLTLVKELTELHKGKIEVISKENVGSEFIVMIPVATSPEPELDDLTNEVNETHKNKVSFSEDDIDRIIDGKPLLGKHKKSKPVLLIVEDDNELRMFLRNEMLDIFDVILAKNGKMGLEMAFQNNPDIILSDIMMPYMDGVEFCRKIKSDQRTSHLPVVLLSALHSHEKQIEGLGMGADDYIFKPFNSELLKTRLKNILNTRIELGMRFQNSTSLKFENESANENDKMLIQSIIDIVLENLTNEKINADFLSRKILISRSVIYAKVEALTGQSVNEFIRNIRLKKSTTLLLDKNYNITDVAYHVGFSSQSYFTRCFTQKFGLSPKDYTKGVPQ